MKKNVWKQTVALWQFGDNPIIPSEGTTPVINVKPPGGKLPYCLKCMYVRRTRTPSPTGVVMMHFTYGGSTAMGWPKDWEIFDQKIKNVIPNAEIAGTEETRGLGGRGIRVMTFPLPSGKNFSDIAMEIARALLKEFGIDDQTWLGHLQLLQEICKCRKGVWKSSATELLDKHGVVVKSIAR
jgi:hypothetical protein